MEEKGIKLHERKIEAIMKIKSPETKYKKIEIVSRSDTIPAKSLAKPLEKTEKKLLKKNHRKRKIVDEKTSIEITQTMAQKNNLC